MPEITITITVPEGTTITVAGADQPPKATSPSDHEEPPDHIGRYWHYLSHNGRKVFGQAARQELHYGPGYTLEDLAHALSIDYESVKSYHRSTGRAAKVWYRDTGLEAPIRLVSEDYDWDPDHQGWRSKYHLPEGVAERVRELELESRR